MIFTLKKSTIFIYLFIYLGVHKLVLFHYVSIMIPLTQFLVDQTRECGVFTQRTPCNILYYFSSLTD